MSVFGTIDRPTTHDPKKQDPTMNRPSAEPFGPEALTRDTHGATAPRQNRNLEMQLIPEALARAHMHERLRVAEAERRAVRLVTARRMQRRAERASLRARRALAMAVMH
ncbi:hypothetical protein QZH56_10720 [Streptomyces olivoreticuli]|uniref:Uncharacterized protein n=1 Tax=Streptomyces blastmyceticus TaxID=68180 RepID=A0ABN0XY91_9ACTN|nr:hypothetical protein [Streptomyces olivoreticuli]WKK26016.1 hypothetical protein QZH56_10720 [Streptomyces olivoreticuli]